MIAAFTVMAATVPAEAAHWRGISGDTYSNKKWYVGNTEHIKDGTGNVTVKFSKVPTGGGINKPTGIRARAALSADGPWGDTVSFTEAGDTSKRLYSGMRSGSSFWVGYSRYETCTFRCDNGFAGSLWA